MSRNNNFGKLIISKCNDNYDTYHDLDLILVRGDRNRIDIDHQIDKLVVNGDNNKIKIGASGDIGEVKLRGNNNIIFARYLTSLNIEYDYGNRNKIFLNNRNEESEDQSSEGESEEYERDRYNYIRNNIDEYEDDNREEEEEEEEEEDDIVFANGLRLNLINGNRRENNYDSQYEGDDGHKKQLKIPTSKEILMDLIDISYKKGSKGITEENEKCVICCENFMENESLKMTQCFHLFHFQCIQKWVESKINIVELPECPICRRKL